MCDIKKLCDKLKGPVQVLWETVLWLVFNVLLPGFPFFLAKFLEKFISFADTISIVLYSDILLLGASLAAGVFESSLKENDNFRKLGLVVSLVSLLFFLGIFFILNVPQIEYQFKKNEVDLEPLFWKIMTWICLINVILGIIADVVLKYIRRGNPNDKERENCS